LQRAEDAKQSLEYHYTKLRHINQKYIIPYVDFSEFFLGFSEVYVWNTKMYIIKINFNM